jgi:hypothetical protein
VHNTVSVDSRDQMTRAGTFLWLDWADGQALRQLKSYGGNLDYWEGSHFGYLRLDSPVHCSRAIIRLPEESWLILDRLHSQNEHVYRLHWLLADFPYAYDQGCISLKTPVCDYHVEVGSIPGPGEISLVRGDPTGVRGWRSVYYGQKEPTISLALCTRANTLWFWTLFSPSKPKIAIANNDLSIKGSAHHVHVALAPEDNRRLVRSITSTGAIDDLLEVVE